jgi:hypothetical protein
MENNTNKRISPKINEAIMVAIPISNNAPVRPMRLNTKNIHTQILFFPL